MAVPAFKAERGASILSLVGSIPTPSADLSCLLRMGVPLFPRYLRPHQYSSLDVWSTSSILSLLGHNDGVSDEQNDSSSYHSYFGSDADGLERRRRTGLHP